MRFTFEPAAPSRGLRLIEAIPDFAVCYLEGLNGVGKSLAVHLLELITGQQPYASSPNAWRSLRANIGPTAVTIDGFSAEPARVVFTPDEWPEAPDPVAEWLGTVEISGKQATIKEIGESFRVFRIAGDETFEDTIRAGVDDERASVDLVRRRFTPRYQSALQRLQEAIELLSPFAPERIQREHAQTAALRARLLDAEVVLRETQEHETRLTRAASALHRVNSISEDLPALTAQQDVLLDDVRALQIRERELERTRARVASSLVRNEGLQKQIGDVERLKNQRLGRLRRAEVRAAELAVRLEIEPKADVVGKELDLIRYEIRRLDTRLTSLDSTRALIAISDAVAQPLATTTARRLDDEIIASIEQDDGASQETSVARLRTGLARHRTELEQREPDAEAASLASELARLRQRSTEIQALAREVAARDRAQELVDEADGKLAPLVARLRSSAEKELQRITEELDSLRNDIQRRTVDEIAVRSQIELLTEGRDPDAASAELVAALEQAGVDDPLDVDAQLASQRTTLQEAEAAVSTLRSELRVAETGLRAIRDDVEPTLAVLRQGNSLQWLVPIIDDASQQNAEDRAIAISQVVAELVATREKLTRLRDILDAVDQALRSISVAISRRERGATNRSLRFENEVRVFFERRLVRQFDQQEIRDALFGGGELTRIDLENLEVSWRGRESGDQTRPIEAFSSGEQAFAYTQARIARVGEQNVPRKVIALDEFGAYLARDRLARLAQYLSRDVVPEDAEQVILILPLAVDYAAQADSTTEPLRTIYKRRAQEIADRGYFAEDATSGLP